MASIDWQPTPGAPSGWHPERIKAELRVRGSSLSAVARDLNVSCPTVSAVIRYRNVRSRRIEAAVASRIGRAPSEIWPDRYPRGAEPTSPPDVGDRLVRAKARSRERAERRAGILACYAGSIENGLTVDKSVAAVRAAFPGELGTSRSILVRDYARVRGRPRTEWPSVLLHQAAARAKGRQYSPDNPLYRLTVQGQKEAKWQTAYRAALKRPEVQALSEEERPSLATVKRMFRDENPKERE